MDQFERFQALNEMNDKIVKELDLLTKAFDRLKVEISEALIKLKKDKKK